MRSSPSGDAAGRQELIEAAVGVGAAVDHHSIRRIESYLGLLEIWNRRLRLTGDRDREVLLRKHVVDSLAVAPELPKTGLVADLGSGAGFPGIVLGCARPDLEIVLVEPRRRAASFLSEAIRRIPLPAVRVVEMRAEQAAGDASLAGTVHLVVSRAIRLDLLLEIGAPLLRADGALIAMQTPSVTTASAGSQAARFGLRLFWIRDYRLPGGEQRRLLAFLPC